MKHCQRHSGSEEWVLFTKVTSLNFNFRISTKYQLQNINQISEFRLNLIFKILTKPSFRISKKIQLHNLYKTSAEKTDITPACLNFKLKILTKPCAQSLSKSLAFWPKLSFQICNKLLPTQYSSLTSATVTSSTSLELASSHARVTSIKSSKQEWVSQSVSQLLTGIANDRTRVR